MRTVRGNIDSELHRQLSRNPCLSPRRILQRHLNNELADVLGQARPTSLRLPSPEQLEALAMPADERFRLDDQQGLFPIEQARPQHEREPSGVLQSSRLHLVLFTKSQLLAQKQDLRAPSCARANCQTVETESVSKHFGDQVRNGTQRACQAKEESEHRVPGWHDNSLVEKGFLPIKPAFAAFSRQGSRRSNS